MKIAIMQPYFLPYIGYFQMIKAVDKFVFYDDVNFIKRGWINRNRILVNGVDFMFTVPIQKVSQNNLICSSMLQKETYSEWSKKFLQTIKLNYKRAPNFNIVFNLLTQLLSKDYNTISELAIESVKTISIYLGLDREFIISSYAYNNINLERQQRLIDICKIEKSKQYINAIGGQNLYSHFEFDSAGIELNFIQTFSITYKQFNSEFIPGLSIVDVLMFNTIEEVHQMLNKFELVK
jgi:hypothetical protein